MLIKEIAKLQILVDHRLALVPAELRESGRVGALIHVGGECAGLKLVSVEQLAVEGPRGR